MSRRSWNAGNGIFAVCSMTKDKNIFIKNIYYMLSYAFQVLRQENYDPVQAEDFSHIQDLFAAILIKGTAQQLKQGLYREYIHRQDTMSVIRGKISMPETMRNRIARKQRLTCEFDELSENNTLNQILKTTLSILCRDKDVAMERKSALRKLLLFFDGVNPIDPSSIHWGRLVYQRSNRNYEMLMNICYFVLDGMLQTTESGEYKIAHFSDAHMARLYERFILAYYIKHHSYLSEVKAAQIKWDLSGEEEEAMIRFLPNMQTDIFLRLDQRILILDAKYYGRTLQQQYDKYSLHSSNLYQIFTYVKNQDKNHSGNVSGMLLYAKTEEAITPDCSFKIGGNQISAGTLDLNANFKAIAAKLDSIVESIFGPQPKKAASEKLV